MHCYSITFMRFTVTIDFRGCRSICYVQLRH